MPIHYPNRSRRIQLGIRRNDISKLNYISDCRSRSSHGDRSAIDRMLQAHRLWHCREGMHDRILRIFGHITVDDHHPSLD